LRLRSPDAYCRFAPPRFASTGCQIARRRKVEALPHQVGEHVLKAEGMTKSYGGIRALEDVSIKVRAGEIVGVMGAN
jgi:ATPase subunit of ABC transporter with duplicated ATPase domains